MKINESNAFRELMDIRGKGFPAEGELTIEGSDPLFVSPFKFGETAASALAARAISANDLWELKTGRRQTINLRVDTAAATCLGGTAQTQKKNEAGVYEGIQASEALRHMVSITQPWKCKDGRWFLPHFNLPHLEKKVLGILGCEGTPEAVSKAVAKWDSADLDKAIYEAGATGGIVLTPEEWLEHPHGKHLASLPVVTITRMTDSKPIPMPEGGDQPLSGIRVLELCRILAGPTCGISLAEHGADVLMVTAPQLPQVPNFVRDVSHGKRSCYLDYTQAQDQEKLHELVKDADIFLEGYRPGCMERHGFGPQDLVKEKEGLIYVSVDCMGPGGIYSDRAGWDQVAQALTGMAFTEGQMEQAAESRKNQMEQADPKLTPVYACDFLTGFLGAFGAMVALRKRALEGGSYHVHVSLCQAAMLMQREGLVTDFTDAPGCLSQEVFDQYAVCDDNTIYGDLKSLGPVIRMSETNPRWDRTTPELGSSPAEWW